MFIDIYVATADRWKRASILRRKQLLAYVNSFLRHEFPGRQRHMASWKTRPQIDSTSVVYGCDVIGAR